MGNSIPCWRCLLDGFLQKVRDKCGLDTSFGQANIKHYRKDAWGRCVTGNIEKLWDLPLGNAVSNGADSLAAIFYPTFQLHHQTFDNRWILVYFMKHLVSQSQKKTVQTELLGVDIRMVTVPGRMHLGCKNSAFSSCAGTVVACAYRLQQGNYADVAGWTVMVERIAAGMAIHIYPLVNSHGNGKMDHLKMYFLFKMVIFHCHVSLLEGNSKWFLKTWAYAYLWAE